MDSDSLSLREGSAQSLRQPVPDSDDPFIGAVFRALSGSDAEPFLHRLAEHPGDQAIGASASVSASALAAAIRAHGATQVGRWFEAPMLAPVTRFTSDPAEALDEIRDEAGVLVALLLRRSRVLFVAVPGTFDVLGFEEDHAQLIGWRAGACPYRLADYDDPASCQEALLDDLLAGNDALMSRAGPSAFPLPLQLMRSTELAAPYEEAVGCLLPALLDGAGQLSRGLHLLESGCVTWYDVATLGAGNELMQVVEVRPSERVRETWEWICRSESVPTPVVAFLKDGLRIG